MVSSPASARSYIEQLMSGYLFDAVESDGVLKFVPRGGGVVATVQRDELVGQDGAEGAAELLQIRRQQEVELPQRVDVLYINRTTNYLQGNQFSQRQVTQSRQVKTISLPIVFSDQSAKVLADQWLYHSWVSRTQYECYVPMRYGRLEPTDIVDIDMGDAVHRVRVTDVMQARPGVMRLRGVAEDVATYDVYLPPAATQSRSQAVVPVGPTNVEMLDLPAFPYDDPTQGVLRMALTGVDAGWRGAVVYRSDDGGSTYGQVSATDEAAVVGRAISVLAEGRHAVLDEKNSVDVLLLTEEELESVPLLSVLNGANLAVLGEEVLQFTTAEWLGDGKYRLSGLLRGRLGTEWAIDSHVLGERFILLNGRIKQMSVAQNGIGLPRIYKPVSVGMSLGNTDAEVFAYGGASWRPYSPVHVTAERDDEGNAMLSWVRRARVGGGWRDNVDVPLNESAERYEVEVLSGETVVRVLSASGTSVGYSAAAQFDDFGSVQTSIRVRVYQLSDVVGRGIAAEVEV